MSENRMKHLIALAAWTAFQGFYLAFHFSWANFALLMVVLLLLAVTTVLGKQQNHTYVVETLGNLLGASFAVLLGYYILDFVMTLFRDYGVTKINECLDTLKYEYEYGVETAGYVYPGRDGMASASLIAALVMLVVRLIKKKRPVAIVLKYAWNGYLFGLFLHKNFHSKEITIAYAAITLVFIACEVLCYRYDATITKVGKRWYNVLLLLLFIMLHLDPYMLEPYCQPGYFEFFFVMNGFKWYCALFALAVLAGAMYFMLPRNEKGRVASYTDAFVFGTAICTLITAFFLTRFHVGYWWILVLLYGIGLAVNITVFHPANPRNAQEKEPILLFLPAVSCAVIISAIAGHYGRLLVVWAILIGAFVVVKLVDKQVTANTWQKIARFYTAVLVVAALVTAVALWYFGRSAYNYTILVGALVVCLAAVWAVTYDSGLFGKKKPISQIATLAVFALLCISLCVQNGGTIKMSTGDTGKTVIVASVKNKDAYVEDVEYYWLESFTQLEKDREDYPKEKLLEEKVLPAGDGRLRIVVTDCNGVKSERVYWMHSNPYAAQMQTEK